MSDREYTAWEPTYPASLHSDVVGECRQAYTNGRPWTQVRVLRKGADDPKGASCSHHTGCQAKVEAVQYSTAFGDPLFYCEEHAVEEQERQVWLYDSKPKPNRPKWTEEDERWVKRFLEKGKRKNRDTESEEIDPA